MTDTPLPKQKRSRLFEGETPRPNSKQTKMADMSVMNDLKISISAIASSVKEIKDGQDSMKKMFESKIHKLRKDIISTIEVLKTDIDLDMAREKSRIDELMTSIQTLTTRLNFIESARQTETLDSENSNGNDQRQGNTQSGFRRPDPLNDNELTVIMKNVVYSEGENLAEKVADIINSLDLTRIAIHTLISRIETARETQDNIDVIYTELCDTIINEMDKNIPCYDSSSKTRKRYRVHKSFWNEELSNLWATMRDKEKSFLNCNGRPSVKMTKRTEFPFAQLPKLRCYERQYKQSFCDEIESITTYNSNEFWAKIKRLGPRK
ncbi:unnamed protein product [Mytilus coruscus]|uniref:Uncharacterized protein n=1 Tax=Mytilus coruscus TaxID=42192 RepID=A0A6J8DLI7_MYTCO|nr:unnamed protein product [Mytilus coruscus]